MRILVIGSGGREHALVWKLGQSTRVEKIFVAPGNAGCAELAELVPIAAENVDELLAFARRESIDLTVVGPEAPLAHGICDRFQEAALPIFGPSQAAARLEASKVFAKDFCSRNDIPTGAYRVFENPEAAYVHLSEESFPVVIKADGLAAGKGVFVAESLDEARKAIHDIMVDRVFGESGRRVVVEEFVEGIEASILTFSDGRTHLPLFASQDHKRVYEGDKGPNTGGMGAYAPLDFIGEDLHRQINERILNPTIAGMAGEGLPYVGILYAGLMITDRGPVVLEFNCRFGDPETQVVLPLLEEDLAELMCLSVEGRLPTVGLTRPDGFAAGVVLASHGYPGYYEKGFVISDIRAAEDVGCLVFHGGTAESSGEIVTAGGRVMTVVGRGETLAAALDFAYMGCSLIDFEGKYFRRDIARFGLERRGRRFGDSS